jgi:hypothetical protein
MKRPRRDTIRKLYREGLLQVFGCGDSELDEHLVKALKKDVHIAGKAPGQWVDEDGVLEIYCESGIPNATDINDYSCYAAEVGCDPSEMVGYNSDKWFAVDKYVNLGLKGLGFSEQIFHEPHNGAVVAVHWS